VPEQSFWFRLEVSSGGGAAELYLGKTPNPLYFQVRDLMSAKGGLEVVDEAATPPPGAAWPGAPPGGVGPSWLISVSSSVSMSLLVK
jgi:hypothetical protein